MKRIFFQQKYSSLEPFAWLGMRISGFLLILTVGTSLLWTDLTPGIENLSSDWLAARWEIPIWQFLDFLLFFLALTHSFNGFRHTLQNAIHSRPLRLVANFGLLIMSVLSLLVIGLVIFWRP